MNAFSKLIISIAASIMTITSCTREFDVPPLPSSEATNFKGVVTHTIAELKNQFTKDLDSIGYYVAIHGIVTGNDESGNIYKKLVIQDTTGAIELSIDQSSIYTQLSVGQEVYVECKGLFIGKYGGVTQLGYKYRNSETAPWQIGRMPAEFISQHVFLKGIPDKKPKSDTIEIAALNTGMIDKLVTFKNIRFTNGGTQIFASKTNSFPTSQEIKDAKGNKIIAYTSSYANFAADTLPKGNGTITGILSYYNGTWQLLIRDKKDIGAFDGKDEGTTPSTTVVTSLNETWDAGVDYGSTLINGWSAFKTLGDRDWQVRINTTDKNKFAQASAHKGTAADYEYWLVTPGLDLDKATQKMIAFQTSKAFWKSTSSLEVYIMNQANPATATKEILNAKIAVEADTDYAWISSGNIDLSAKSGVVYIGFRYVAKGGESNSTTFRIDNFLFGDQVK